MFAYDVEAEIRHAAATHKDLQLILTRSSSGEFTADISQLEPGQWNVRFNVKSQPDGGIVFQAQKDILVLP